MLLSFSLILAFYCPLEVSDDQRSRRRRRSRRAVLVNLVCVTPKQPMACRLLHLNSFCRPTETGTALFIAPAPMGCCVVVITLVHHVQVTVCARNFFFFLRLCRETLQHVHTRTRTRAHTNKLSSKVIHPWGPCVHPPGFCYGQCGQPPRAQSIWGRHNGGSIIRSSSSTEYCVK